MHALRQLSGNLETEAMAAYLKYRFLQLFCQWLPVKAGYCLAAIAADLRWCLSLKTRQAVSENLSFLLGGSAASHQQDCRKVFRSFGYYLFETFSMHRLKAPHVITEGLEHLEAAKAAQHGVIVLTAHLGNWELGAKVLQQFGIATAAVALPHADERLNRLFNELRTEAGVRVIALDRQAYRESLGVLSKQGVLALLADQVYSGEGVAVNLAQGKLRIPEGPAVLSLRSGAAILPVFLVREGWWRFKLICKQPIFPASCREASIEQSVESCVQKYAKVLETMLKRYARQWLMLTPVFQAA